MAEKNQAILDWQNAFPAFGVTYLGPKDGIVNPQFIAAMLALESKLKAYGEIFTGSGVKMSVTEAQKKYLSPETPKQETTKVETKPEAMVPNNTKVWESFLSQSLPVVGKVYDGDLASAGKKLEAAIGKSINKPTAGLIWNDTKKQFNTTPDDVKKALELIRAHQQKQPKTAEFTQDERIVMMAKFLSENKVH